MKIVELRRGNHASDFPKSDEAYGQFNRFINELNSWNFPDDTVSAVNGEIEELNATATDGNRLKVLIQKKLAKISKVIEIKHKVVPVNYYRNVWINRGMTLFGIPLSIVMGAIGMHFGYIALFVVGMPLGMFAGFALGSSKDNNALREGRQLNIDLKQNI